MTTLVPTRHAAAPLWPITARKLATVSPLMRPFRARLAIPGSKSYTNRALLLAAFASGKSQLVNPLFSEDTHWCRQALAALGVETGYCDKTASAHIHGGYPAHRPTPETTIHIGSAGTLARFLPGLLAAAAGGRITLSASDQLASRPVRPLVEALRTLGAEIELPSAHSFPMNITGGTLHGGTATICGAISSQYLSGLLMAAPLAENPVTLHVKDGLVQPDYVRITLALMKQFGVHVDHHADLREFHIMPQPYKAADLMLEADASTATCFFSLAAATASRLTVTNLSTTTLQPDHLFLGHLKTMGCHVHTDGANITVIGPTQLKGGQKFDFSACSDSSAALAAIMPFADKAVTLSGVSHIRHHECDRLHVLVQNLQAAGVHATERKDGIFVDPTASRRPFGAVFATFAPHDDHRMAMAFSVLAAAGCGGRILKPGCVAKTCPSFFDLLATTGVPVSHA